MLDNYNYFSCGVNFFADFYTDIFADIFDDLSTDDFSADFSSVNDSVDYFDYYFYFSFSQQESWFFSTCINSKTFLYSATFYSVAVISPSSVGTAGHTYCFYYLWIKLC